MRQWNPISTHLIVPIVSNPANQIGQIFVKQSLQIAPHLSKRHDCHREEVGDDVSGGGKPAAGIWTSSQRQGWRWLTATSASLTAAAYQILYVGYLQCIRYTLLNSHEFEIVWRSVNELVILWHITISLGRKSYASLKETSFSESNRLRITGRMIRWCRSSLPLFLSWDTRHIETDTHFPSLNRIIDTGYRQRILVESVEPWLWANYSAVAEQLWQTREVRDLTVRDVSGSTRGATIVHSYCFIGSGSRSYPRGRTFSGDR